MINHLKICLPFLLMRLTNHLKRCFPTSFEMTILGSFMIISRDDFIPYHTTIVSSNGKNVSWMKSKSSQEMLITSHGKIISRDDHNHLKGVSQYERSSLETIVRSNGKNPKIVACDDTNTDTPDIP